MLVCSSAQTPEMIDINYEMIDINYEMIDINYEMIDINYGLYGCLDTTLHVLFSCLPFSPPLLPTLCRELLNDSNFHTALQRVNEEPIPLFKQFSSSHSNTHTDQQQTTHSNLKETIDQQSENISFSSQEGKQVVFSEGEEKRERDEGREGRKRE